MPGVPSQLSMIQRRKSQKTHLSLRAKNTLLASLVPSERKQWTCVEAWECATFTSSTAALPQQNSNVMATC